MKNESALIIRCGDAELIGIAHLPPRKASFGVLILVGGPQYRVGSHRQFVLLSRALAEAGIPVLRIDHRGIGDSGGAPRSFEALDDDIKSAVDAFFDTCPQLESVYLWGLCDAATAASLYAERDPRLAGLVLLNPWVRPEDGVSKSFLRHYYAKRLFDPTFWKGAFSGKRSLWAIFRSAMQKLFDVAGPHDERKRDAEGEPGLNGRSESVAMSGTAYQMRMRTALQNFKGRILIILSGNDLTALEFRQLVNGSRKWKKIVRKATTSWIEMPEANHTFSTRTWRNEVAEQTVQWLRKP